MKMLFLGSVFFFSSFALAQNPESPERKLLAEVKKQIEETIRFLDPVRHDFLGTHITKSMIGAFSVNSTCDKKVPAIRLSNGTAVEPISVLQCGHEDDGEQQNNLIRVRTSSGTQVFVPGNAIEPMLGAFGRGTYYHWLSVPNIDAMLDSSGDEACAAFEETISSIELYLSLLGKNLKPIARSITLPKGAPVYEEKMNGEESEVDISKVTILKEDMKLPVRKILNAGVMKDQNVVIISLHGKRKYAVVPPEIVQKLEALSKQASGIRVDGKKCNPPDEGQVTCAGDLAERICYASEIAKVIRKAPSRR